MGREIRRVPANWEHPKDETNKEKYDSLSDGFEERLEKFLKDVEEKGMKEAIHYWGGGPNYEDYVDYKGEPATWYQMYQTVSEGYPITPPFATTEELINHLVNNGDDWDGKWSREGAENFVKDGWAPSMVFSYGKIYKPEDMHKLKSKEYNG